MSYMNSCCAENKHASLAPSPALAGPRQTRPGSRPRPRPAVERGLRTRGRSGSPCPTPRSRWPTPRPTCPRAPLTPRPPSRAPFHARPAECMRPAPPRARGARLRCRAASHCAYVQAGADEERRLGRPDCHRAAPSMTPTSTARVERGRPVFEVVAAAGAGAGDLVRHHEPPERLRLPAPPASHAPAATRCAPSKSPPPCGTHTAKKMGRTWCDAARAGLASSAYPPCRSSETSPRARATATRR